MESCFAIKRGNFVIFAWHDSCQNAVFGHYFFRSIPDSALDSTSCAKNMVFRYWKCTPPPSRGILQNVVEKRSREFARGSHSKIEVKQHKRVSKHLYLLRNQRLFKLFNLFDSHLAHSVNTVRTYSFCLINRQCTAKCTIFCCYAKWISVQNAKTFHKMGRFTPFSGMWNGLFKTGQLNFESEGDFNAWPRIQAKG